MQTPTEISADIQIQSRHTPIPVSPSPSGEITVPDPASLKTMLNTTETNTDLLQVLGAYEELNKQLIQCIPAYTRQ